MNWQSIFYYLGWAVLFAIMMRFGCGAHVMGHARRLHRDDPGGHGTANESHEQPTASMLDPVCGMKVAADSAVSAVYQGKAYYFCSGTCREKFEANPRQYSASPARAASGKEHRHGCC